MVQFKSDHLMIQFKSDQISIQIESSDGTVPIWSSGGTFQVWSSDDHNVSIQIWRNKTKLMRTKSGSSKMQWPGSGFLMSSPKVNFLKLLFTKAEVSSLIVASVVTLKVFSSWSCLFGECGCSVITRTHWNLKLSAFRWMWNFCNYSDKGGVGIVKEQRHLFNHSSSPLSSSYWRWWWWHGQRKGGGVRIVREQRQLSSKQSNSATKQLFWWNKKLLFVICKSGSNSNVKPTLVIFERM